MTDEEVAVIVVSADGLVDARNALVRRGPGFVAVCCDDGLVMQTGDTLHVLLPAIREEDDE